MNTSAVLPRRSTLKVSRASRSMFIQLQEHAKTSTGCRIRPVGGNVVLGNHRYFFNENVFPGNRCCYRGAKNRAIVFISLRMQPDAVHFFDLANASGAARISNNPIANARVMGD